jgi:hypothetical protein
MIYCERFAAPFFIAFCPIIIELKGTLKSIGFFNFFSHFLSFLLLIKRQPKMGYLLRNFHESRATRPVPSGNFGVNSPFEVA